MIFVTVGSQKFPFDRLIKKVDEMIRENLIEEEVIIQTGTSKYVPVCRCQAFYEKDVFAKLLEDCDILITHGGAGTMVDAVKRRKKIVVVPRLARYEEHVDDHQLELTEQFHKMNLVYSCPDVNLLQEALETVRTHEFDRFPSNTAEFIRSLDNYIRCGQEERRKVLIIGPSETRSRGGMAEVIRGMKKSKILSREFEIESFPSYIDGSLPVRLLYSLYGYIRFLRCYRKYDLFHIHTAERGSTFRKNFYLRTVKKAGKKAIVHIHGAEYLTFYDRLGSQGKAVVDGFFRQADLVLALSDSWKQELEARFRMKSCRTLYNGVEPARFQKAVSAPEAHSNAFVMLGRLGERKGTYDLIAAVETAIRQNPALTICLAGDGEVEKVRALVKEKGLEKHITVPGWIDGTEKLKRLRDAATLVLPSYHEGLPIAILEGMAAGKAIISTTVGAIPEVVTEENGILVEPGDISSLAEAMLRCSSNIEQLKNMSQKNLEKAEKMFSVRQMHQRLAEYYRQIMK